MKALVTGGTSNLGKAICLELLENKYEVYATYTNNENEAQIMSEKYGITFFHLDVCDEKEVASVFSQFPSLDLLVNNSGVFSVSKQEHLALNAFNSVMQINTTGVFLCCKHAIPKLNKRSSIINISSINAMAPVFKKTVHYDASKGFVSTYTRSLAVELGENMIRVNAVAPGLLEAGYLEDKANPTKDEFIERAVIKRTVKPKEVADAVMFLVNNKAITGEIITVDCGFLIG